jgi:hypothetical protein
VRNVIAEAVVLEGVVMFREKACEVRIKRKGRTRMGLRMGGQCANGEQDTRSRAFVTFENSAPAPFDCGKSLLTLVCSRHLFRLFNDECRSTSNVRTILHRCDEQWLL